jgi:hypothetical protein
MCYPVEQKTGLDLETVFRKEDSTIDTTPGIYFFITKVVQTSSPMSACAVHGEAKYRRASYICMFPIKTLIDVTTCFTDQLAKNSC